MKIWKRDIDLRNINKKMDNTLASHLGIKITNIDDNSLEVTINYRIVGLPLNQQSLNLILERV